MKLILSIINSSDAHNVSLALTKAKIQITKLSSSGGFLKKGNVTFITGVEDEKVDEVIEIISNNSSKREQYLPSTKSEMETILFNTLPFNVTVGGAIIFILDIEKFLKI